jgi:flavin reductase (DIM6/NTAB) family NADH-FMN oxidoreductase RutF
MTTGHGTGSPALDAPTLRRAFGRFPSGVTAVSAVLGGVPVGMAVSSFTSVSLDPPLVLICVARASATWADLRTAPRLGLSVLGRSHASLCRQLAGPAGERFSDVGWQATDEGAVVLAEAALWLECRLEQEVEAGDHVLAVLAVTAVEPADDIAPLVFHNSTFHDLLPAGERNRPETNRQPV